MTATRCVEHLWIPLPDGTHLAARLWLPEVEPQSPVPALIEYLPYRKSDGTAVSDPVRHAWYAANGFASLRIDLRGSGDSDGLLLDEYLPQEQFDAVDAIAWIAAQPWCNGRVGMFGISWGGFNALQVAALRPPALQCIISVCSTDDRYNDDVHYLGGCVQAFDMLSWATTFTAMQTRPPLPAVRPEDWRREWLARIDAMPHFAAQWLAHPQRDAYWQQGSLIEDYGAITIPVFLVGGWADAYTNAIPRMLAGLKVPRQALIGPWAHAWPNAARPGPTINFLSLSLRWWRRWLCDDDNGIDNEPMLRAWEQDWVPPAELQKERPGRWIAESHWPAVGPHLTTRTWQLTDAGLQEGEPMVISREVGTDLQHGMDGGAWCPFGARGDFPGDQRWENGRSLCFATPIRLLSEAILGAPRVCLRLQSDQPRAQLILRLCDLAPDGSALLVSRGVLDLGQVNQHADSQPLVPGHPFDVEVNMDVIAHRLPAGHAWLLAIGASYWPMVWPEPALVRLTVLAGDVSLPMRSPIQLDSQQPAFGSADGADPMPVESLRPPALKRERCLEAGVLNCSSEVDGGEIRFGSGWTIGQRSEDLFQVSVDQPLTAVIRCNREFTQGDAQRNLRSHVTAEMTCDATHFIVKQKVQVYEDVAQARELLRERNWHKRLPRRT